MQGQSPAEAQQHALSAEGQDPERKLFVIFFGGDDYALVSASHITSFQEGLAKCGKIQKASKTWKGAVRLAEAYLRAEAADLDDMQPI